MRTLLGFIIGLVLCISFSWAGPKEDCAYNQDLDARIRGCNILLQQKASTVDRVNQHNNLCIAYSNKADYQQAVASCTRAIEINPAYAFAYNNRCLARNKLREYDLALADCNKSLDLNNPGPQFPIKNRGDAYLGKGEIERAIEDYTRSLELLPSYDQARQALAAAVKLRDERQRAQSGDASTSDASSKSKVEITPLVAHSKWVDSIAFSPDGSFIVSGSQDGKLKLWETSTGRLLRTMRGHNEGVSSVAFAPDGKAVLSGGKDSGVKLWDVASGEFIRHFYGHTKSVTAIAFSSDGRRLASASYDNTVVLWDVQSGKRLSAFKGHAGPVFAVTFSPDGSRVLSGAGGNSYPRTVDNTAKLWDADTGRVLQSFRHSDQVNALAFSPDGQQVLSGSSDKTMKLWDAGSGRMLRSFTGHEYQIDAVAFSRDGSTVISAAIGGIKVWDVASGQLRRDWDTSARSVAVSPNGLYLAAGTTENGVSVWELATGKVLHANAAATVATPKTVAFSPDGSRIVSGSDNAVRLWQVPASVRTFAGYRVKATFSPDGNQILIGGDKTLTLVDAATGKQIRTFSGVPGYIEAVAFSPDGSRVLAALGFNVSDGGKVLERGRVKMWDAATGTLLRTFAGHSSGISALAFTPDGSQLVTAGNKDGAPDAVIGNGKVRFWNPATGQMIRNIDAQFETIKAMAISPDGSRLATGSSYDPIVQGRLITSIQTLRIWDAKSGRMLHSVGPNSEVNAVAFSPDGKQVLAGSSDNQLMLYDADSGRLIRRFDGHSGSIDSVAFSHNGTRVLSASEDRTIRMWNTETGELLATLIGENEAWLVITPAGFFAASSPNDAQALTITRGLQLYDVNQIYQALYDPDLVREKLAGDPTGEFKRAAGVLDLAKVIDSGQPPEISLLSPTSGDISAEEIIPARARLVDRGGGIGRVEWRINGITVSVTAPASGGADQIVSQTLALDPGSNNIEVVAYNGRNLLASMPSRMSVTFSGAADTVKPNLYILAVGINSYIDTGWVPPNSSNTLVFPKLSLAVKDAESFAAQLKRAAADRYGEVRTTLALDTEATAENLQRIAERLAAEVHPRDTFILYAAAHGISEDGHFYLIPQDYQGGPDSLRNRAIGQDRLQDWIVNRVRAKRVVMLLDTCESGALVSGAGRSRTDVPTSEAAIGRLHEATGRPVLTAAAEGKPAYEGYEGHGVFTWALLDALKNGDRNGNGQIELSELVAHVQDQVPKIAAKLDGRGRAALAARGSGEDRQSARFGSRGEDFVLVGRLP